MRSSSYNLMQLTGKIIRRLRKIIRRYFRPRHWLRQVWHSPRLLGDRYTPIDNTQVTVYTDRADLFPAYRPRRPVQGQPRLRRAGVTLISTTFN